MSLPTLSLGRAHLLQAVSLTMPHDLLGVQPAQGWQGVGSVTCGDGVTTPIYFCGDPVDVQFHTTSIALSICQDRGGLRSSEGRILPFVPCTRQ